MKRIAGGWRLAIAAALYATVPTGGAAQSPARDTSGTALRRMLSGRYQRYAAAFAAANAEGVAALYDTAGSRLYTGGVIVRGRAAIVADLRSFLTSVGQVKATIAVRDAWQLGDLLYETGDWSYAFTPPGKALTTLRGQYLTVWKRQQDQSWLILADAAIPPPVT